LIKPVRRAPFTMIIYHRQSSRVQTLHEPNVGAADPVDQA